MTLLHYTRDPLVFDPSRKYKQGESYFKPVGFWVSAGEEGADWKRWCVGEHFSIDRLCAVSQVQLRRDHGCLVLRDVADLYAFTREYVVRPGSSEYYQYTRTINWPRVVRDYPGILIPEYIWSCRLDDRVSWYYPWDAASGCIWDLSSIESVRPLSYDPDFPSKVPKPDWMYEEDEDEDEDEAA